MNVTDTHQRADIRFVRLSGQRVAKKQDRFDRAFRHPASDDQVTAKRAVCNPLNVQPQPIVQHFPRVARGDEYLATKEIHPRRDKLQQFVLESIMSNERDHDVSVSIASIPSKPLAFVALRSYLCLTVEHEYRSRREGDTTIVEEAVFGRVS